MISSDHCHLEYFARQWQISAVLARQFGNRHAAFMLLKNSQNLAVGKSRLSCFAPSAIIIRVSTQNFGQNLGGLHYPGRGKSGDLPPDPRCAATWRESVVEQLKGLGLTIVIGQYAMEWHLDKAKSTKLTDVVKNWRDYDDSLIPIPHPSPRNNIWLKKNQWFEEELVPVLWARVERLLRT